MALRFTRSVDGKERANITVTIRLTKEEIEIYSSMCRDMGETLRERLQNACLDDLNFRLDEQHKDHMKYVGKTIGK